MADATSDSIVTSGGVLAGLVLAVLAFFTIIVGFYALDEPLTGTILLTVGAIALAVWVVGGVYVSRAD